MAKNKISDLRDHLFETLEALKDQDKPMDIERAKAISGVAQTIINSAKVEIDLVKAVGGSSPGGSTFFNLPEESRDVPKLLKAHEGGGMRHGLSNEGKESRRTGSVDK